MCNVIGCQLMMSDHSTNDIVVRRKEKSAARYIAREQLMHNRKVKYNSENVMKIKCLCKYLIVCGDYVDCTNAYIYMS